MGVWVCGVDDREKREYHVGRINVTRTILIGYLWFRQNAAQPATSRKGAGPPLGCNVLPCFPNRARGLEHQRRTRQPETNGGEAGTRCG